MNKKVEKYNDIEAKMNEIKKEKENVEKKLNESEIRVKIIKEEMVKKISKFYNDLFENSFKEYNQKIYKSYEEKLKAFLSNKIKKYK